MNILIGELEHWRALCTVCSALAGAALMQLPPMRLRMHGVLRGGMWRGRASKQAGGRAGRQVGKGGASIIHHRPIWLATRYSVARGMSVPWHVKHALIHH